MRFLENGGNLVTKIFTKKTQLMLLFIFIDYILTDIIFRFK